MLRLDPGGLTLDNLAVEYGCVIFAIAESPLEKGELWVGTDDSTVQVSSDGGRTWGPLELVATDPPNTVGNPCPVVDRATGRLWLLLTHNLGEDTEAVLQRLGYTADEIAALRAEKIIGWVRSMRPSATFLSFTKSVPTPPLPRPPPS